LRRYPTAEVDTVLGLIGIALFVVGIISLAALVTYVVIRLTPQRTPKKSEAGG
jgi:hypothetical protein